eukprot:GILK01012154.1.p1 GENE.GILK01012154.1~~GILK01012154.1.p1  ORF type:complete len:108 (-),score=4.46 GILK01012154.1:234-557(-)
MRDCILRPKSKEHIAEYLEPMTAANRSKRVRIELLKRALPSAVETPDNGHLEQKTLPTPRPLLPIEFLPSFAPPVHPVLFSFYQPRILCSSSVVSLRTRLCLPPCTC